MVTQNRKFLSVAAAALASMILIGNAAAVTLNQPPANAVIAQNDPTIGCPSNPTHGYGFEIKFRWSAPTAKNFSYYHLLVQRGTSIPIMDDNGHNHKFNYLACGVFVIDSNLSGWHWQVTAFDVNGKLLETSELRSFSFAPCRVSGGQACFSGP